MVFTNAQKQAFFLEESQMGIPAETLAQLNVEGIREPQDLAQFDEEDFNKIEKNLRNPPGRVPNPDPDAPEGSTIPRPPFPLGAMSLKRLMVAADIVRYYVATNRPLTAANMRWDPTIMDFMEQFKPLKAAKEKDPPELPKITNKLPIMKWIETFNDYCRKKIGVRMAPLAYVIRENADVHAAAPELVSVGAGNVLSYSAEHGSVEDEFISRTTHMHATFRIDNAEIYHDLEKATRSTPYAATIKPYQRTRDGRGAYLALKQQYAGRDKFMAEIRAQEDMINKREWTGQGNFTLERFIAQHRNAFTSMQECARHVDFQLPNDLTRVDHLLRAIKCNDFALNTAKAIIEKDYGPGGMMHDFEQAASYLVQYDPVAKKQRESQSGKRNSNEISAMKAEASVKTASSKPSTGKTGVEFRFYTAREYNKLTGPQKDELREWRRQRPDQVQRGNKLRRRSQNGDRRRGNQQSTVSAAVTQERDDLDARLREAIRSVINSTSADSMSNPATKPPQQVIPAQLQSILGRARPQGQPGQQS
jgi:hypothetical protein